VELYLRGLDENDPDVASFKWRTADNPLIPASEIADARRNMSERSFRSLYEGEFLDVGGSVFRNVQKAATGVLKPGEGGRRYVGGLDLAKTVDWTVATILDEEAHEVVGWERWHGCSWELTAQRVLDELDGIKSNPLPCLAVLAVASVRQKAISSGPGTVVFVAEILGGRGHVERIELDMNAPIEVAALPAAAAEGEPA